MMAGVYKYATGHLRLVSKSVVGQLEVSHLDSKSVTRRRIHLIKSYRKRNGVGRREAKL